MDGAEPLERFIRQRANLPPFRDVAGDADRFGAGAAWRAATVATRAARSTSATTTFMPSAANRSAKPRPMPFAPPVTIATFPLNSVIEQRRLSRSDT
jgi:hypothetical protein